ncbi:glycosyltransferase involved in cell wall biosynthesis [Spirosoma lacussanchae]|uniref:glycosyltransferase family 2 protein n=1 Tax=Spirosoma lacussanchae TaxID=1884249 RepID=UPI00110948FD|nr:glycosyltransferase family A protein [Spirosoma lacussanchae]
MNWFKNPDWINQHAYPYERLADVPGSVFAAINARLDKQPTGKPDVSIVIAAYNEEVNLIRCVSSLAALETSIPFEIIVVNNNSTDQTAETLDRLHVRSALQPIQGCGPARQMGQELALGDYVLLADADCLYPPVWLDEMTRKLRKPGVSCVYGRYSFIAQDDMPRWQLALHETLRDLIAEVRHVNRPYLNAFGMSMGYNREAGLKAGFVMQNIRGEDGRMCFDLMQYGRVAAMKNNAACVWTGPRSLLRDGNFWQALGKRVLTELQRPLSYLTPHPPHDTKTSKN